MFAAIATTPAGGRSLLPICAALPATLWIPATMSAAVDIPADAVVQFYQGSLRALLAELWFTHRGLILALATGAVVRLIAPLLQDKSTDPAVVVVDAAGKWAISLCGGHQGGGDRLTHQISQILSAMPITTGAANAQQLPGIDVLGQPFGWQQGTGNWTAVASAIAQGQAVQVIQEAGSSLWEAQLPEVHSLQLGWTEGSAKPSRPAPQARVWISPVQRRFAVDTAMPKVQWHPRVLWVGLGCERGTSKALMAQAITAALQSRHLAMGAIAGVASLDLKADEPGLVQLCEERGWPLR
ncbi:MAG: cobalamin biosynthesis protein, partial [Cyanobacteria bacterium P01_C01_bin.70]